MLALKESLWGTVSRAEGGAEETRRWEISCILFAKSFIWSSRFSIWGVVLVLFSRMWTRFLMD